MFQVLENLLGVSSGELILILHKYLLHTYLPVCPPRSLSSEQICICDDLPEWAYGNTVVISYVVVVHQ